MVLVDREIERAVYTDNQGHTAINSKIDRLEIARYATRPAVEPDLPLPKPAPKAPAPEPEPVERPGYALFNVRSAS